MNRFEDEFEYEESWRSKGARFLRYLSTRKMECWGFLCRRLPDCHNFLSHIKETYHGNFLTYGRHH